MSATNIISFLKSLNKEKIKFWYDDKARFWFVLLTQITCYTATIIFLVKYYL